VIKTGDLPAAGDHNWFEVAFPDNGNLGAYHPKISLSSTDPNIVFLVFSSTCSGGQPFGCGNATTWETSYTANANLSEGGTLINIGTGGTIFVAVYRPSGVGTCDQYTITFSD